MKLNTYEIQYKDDQGRVTYTETIRARTTVTATNRANRMLNKLCTTIPGTCNFEIVSETASTASKVTPCARCNDSKLEYLTFDEKLVCNGCSDKILWGEPFSIAGYCGDIMCSGCEPHPWFRNGPATATEAACAALRRELLYYRTQRYELVNETEALDDALGVLEELAAKDIVPVEIRIALEGLRKIKRVFPIEYPRDTPEQ